MYAPEYENLPPSHTLQLVALVDAAYWPPLHVSHEEEPIPALLPVSHVVHMDAPLDENLPASHSVHSSALAFEYEPPSHCEGAAAGVVVVCVCVGGGQEGKWEVRGR